MGDLEQYTKELYKPVKLRYKRRNVITKYPLDIVSADLIDLNNLNDKNKGVKYLLSVIDIYSRYAWLVPLNDKTGKTVLNALKSLEIKPTNLWCDEGAEFFNKECKTWCKDNNINLYHTFSEVKGSHIERFNRTIKEKIFKTITLKQTGGKYVDFLPNILNEYNNKIHSKTKETPYNVFYEDKLPALNNEEDILKPNYEVGDFVRISRVKKTFEKGYLIKWSIEVYKIKEVHNTQPPTYTIEDQQKEEIKGKFYEEELQKTDLQDFALIEKIIRNKKVGNRIEYFVKYVGYDDKFNEWISEDKLQDLQN
jgi:hypothetical protein